MNIAYNLDNQNRVKGGRVGKRVTGSSGGANPVATIRVEALPDAPKNDDSALPLAQRLKLFPHPSPGEKFPLLRAERFAKRAQILRASTAPKDPHVHEREQRLTRIFDCLQAIRFFEEEGGEASRKEAAYYGYLLVQELREEKKVIDDLGVEREARAELNKKISTLFGAAREPNSESVALLTKEILEEIDRHALRLSIKQEIHAFSEGKEAVRSAHRDQKMIGRFWINPEAYEEALQILHKSESLLEKGDEQNARALYLEFAQTGAHRTLLFYLDQTQRYERGKQLGLSAAIVITSGFAAHLAAGALAPYLAGTTIGRLGVVVAEGAAFVASHRVLSATLTEEKLLHQDGLKANLEDIAEEVLFTSAMFPYLRKVGKISREVAASFSQVRELSKARAAISGFLGEFAGFTVWEEASGIAQAGSHGNFDPKAVAEHVYSIGATRDRLLFLGSLKLGHHIASPVFKPIGAKVHAAILEKHARRLQEFGERRAKILKWLDLADLSNPKHAKMLEPTFKELVSLARERISILKAFEEAAPREVVVQEEQSLRNAEQFFRTVRSLKEPRRKEAHPEARPLRFRPVLVAHALPNDAGSTELPGWLTRLFGLGEKPKSSLPSIEKSGSDPDVPTIVFKGDSDLAPDIAVEKWRNFTLGRKRTGGKPQKTDIPIPVPYSYSVTTLSGTHFRLQWRGNHWWIENFSRNGTKVNGVEVPPEGTRLSQGAKIEAGGRRWLVRWEEPTRTPQRPQSPPPPPDAPRATAATEVVPGDIAPTELPARLTFAAQLVAQDLSRFAHPPDAASLRITGLGKTLHDRFMNGDEVSRSVTGNHHHFWQRLSGADTVYAEETPPATYNAYRKWRERLGFAEAPRGEEDQLALKKLVDFGREHGIEITARRWRIKALQAEYVEALLRMLPEGFLRSGYIKGIVFGSSRVGIRGAAMGSAFVNDEVRLYSGALEGPRRNLLGYLFHELGHSTAHRYALNADENRSGVEGGEAPVPPDERIPFEVRKKMHADFEAIQSIGDVYEVEWGYGEVRRGHTAGSFSEFIAELHLLHVADGHGLRSHIRMLKFFPRTRAAGEAYERIYQELKERVFGGREYGLTVDMRDKSVLRKLKIGPLSYAVWADEAFSEFYSAIYKKDPLLQQYRLDSVTKFMTVDQKYFDEKFEVERATNPQLPVVRNWGMSMTDLMNQFNQYMARNTGIEPDELHSDTMTFWVLLTLDSYLAEGKPIPPNARSLAEEYLQKNLNITLVLPFPSGPKNPRGPNDLGAADPFWPFRAIREGFQKLFGRGEPASQLPRGKSIHDLIHRDIQTLQGQYLPGIKSELQELFLSGQFVIHDPKKGYVWLKPILELADFLSSEATRADYEAYMTWRGQMGFPNQAAVEMPMNLIKYGRDRGITVTINHNVKGISPQQEDYLLAILKSLPHTYFDPQYLQAIRLGGPRTNFNRPASGGVYDEGAVYLFPDVLHGPRPLLLHTFIHELSHAATARFWDEPKSATGERTRARRDLYEAWHVIRDNPDKGLNSIFQPLSPGNRVYASRGMWGRVYWHRYTSGLFLEFLAEVCTQYIIDGEGLRKHIETLKSLPETRKQGQSYEMIYDVLKDTIFWGREYSP